MNNKKLLSLILAFAMVLSSITAVSAGTMAAVSSDAETISAIEVLKGDSADGVTKEYLAKETTRIQAAVMYLRLQGKEKEALAFTGTGNFNDADTIAWAGGKAVMAYLKANPQLGWIGSETGGFNPSEKITVKQYYKVMLEALGYRQSTADTTGDFEWKSVMSFAKSKGLDKLTEDISFTNNDLAIATVEALKAKVKGTAVTLAVKLVDAGIVNKASAIKTGLYGEDTPPETTVKAEVEKAVSLGNTVVQVTFEDDIDKTAGDAGSYSIKGLTVSSAVITGPDTVWLVTSAQKAGTLYVLTAGKKSISFSGIAAVTGGPSIADSYSEDVNQVVLTFDRNVDYDTATSADNYTIEGVDIIKAEVTEGNEVTLTTEGLKNNTSYTIKAQGIKSVDGVVRKSSSDTFRARFDVAAPRIDSTNSKAETNQRIILYFNEKVTEKSAEDLGNYTIKVNESDGAELDIISAVWDNDNENNVEITTEAMTRGKSYKLTVSNIADQRKSANVMTKADTWTFKGIREDNDAPELSKVTAISKDRLVVEFADDSRLDEKSVLDTGSYTFKRGTADLDVEDAQTLKNETGIFRALLKVEAMEAGKSYKLVVDGIADEFGNSMEEESKSFTPKVADFASAALVKVAVNSKTSLSLSFSKELDEASAENIGNYSIDGGIGAPLAATLESDGMTVELKVNELKNGEKYDLTVDGVKDLAGNTLKFTKQDIVATADDKWDTEAPELEDAYADNIYVASLKFNEEVKFAAGTELWLKGGGYTAGSPLKLKAKTLAENNTVVEFLLYSDGKWAELEEDEEYTIIKVSSSSGTGITDLIGNKFVMPDEDYTFDGSDNDPDYARFESYEQTNESTFEVKMSKNVIFKDADDRAAEEAEVNGFRVTIDDDIVSFVGKITEDKEYIFDLRKFLTDERGMAVVNDEVDDSPAVNRTVLVGGWTDNDEPYMMGAKAIDNVTVEIEFSENISAAAEEYFKIENVDLDKNVTIDALKIDKKIVTLTLSTHLEGRYEYELKLVGNKVADFAGNKAKEDTIYFNGSDLAPVK